MNYKSSSPINGGKSEYGRYGLQGINGSIQICKCFSNMYTYHVGGNQFEET